MILQTGLELRRPFACPHATEPAWVGFRGKLDHASMVVALLLVRLELCVVLQNRIVRG